MVAVAADVADAVAVVVPRLPVRHRTQMPAHRLRLQALRRQRVVKLPPLVRRVAAVRVVVPKVAEADGVDAAVAAVRSSCIDCRRRIRFIRLRAVA